MATSNAPPSPAPAAVLGLDPDLLRNLDEHLIVDTSEREPVYLLSGRSGCHIRLSASAVQLLRQVGRGASFEDIAEALSQRDARTVSPADVAASYRTVVDRIAAIEARGDRLRGAFWFRRGILPGPWVNRIARACAVAFHPAFAVLVLGSIVALAVALAVVDPSLFTHRALSVDAGQFWPAYGLLLASLVAHEVGHASACARYGARPAEIGLALYVIYPVFYSNVSAAWTLKRGQRVVVDLGGVYFQLIVGMGYAAGYALFGWEPLRMAIVFVIGSCIFSLNPILKFDGYWVVADALGVTNLSRQPARILRHLAARLRGQPTPDLPWRRSVTATLAIYAALSIGFWGWFLWQAAPALVPYVVNGVDTLVTLAAQLASSAWPDGKQLQAGLSAAYVLLLVGLMLWRALRAVLRMLPVPRHGAAA